MRRGNYKKEIDFYRRDKFPEEKFVIYRTMEETAQKAFHASQLGHGRDGATLADEVDAGSATTTEREFVYGKDLRTN